MKTEKIKASDVKQLSLFKSRSNLTAFKAAAFFSSVLKIPALSEQFQFKARRIFKWGERRNEVTGLGYSSSQGNLQNKLVGIDKQARGWGKPTPESRGSRKNKGNGSSHWPCLWRGLAGKDAQHSHSTPNSLKMQQNGNQTSAQWDVSDSCHQAEGTNFVFFCHSDSGYSFNRDLQVALPSRTRAGELCSLSFPSLLTLPLTHQKSWKKTSVQHLRAMHPPFPWSSASLFSPLDWTVQKLLLVCSTSFYPWRSRDEPLETDTSSAIRLHPCFFICILKNILALLPCSVTKGCERITQFSWVDQNQACNTWRMWDLAKSLHQSQPLQGEWDRSCSTEGRGILFANQNTSHRYHCLHCTFDTHGREKMLRPPNPLPLLMSSGSNPDSSAFLPALPSCQESNNNSQLHGLFPLHMYN